MKILYVTDTFYPNISGSTIIVDRYARELIKRGHEIEILSMGNKIIPSKKINPDGITVHSAPSVKNPIRTNYYIPLVYPRYIKKIVDTFKPDLIHIFSPVTLGLRVKLYAKNHGIKVVMSCFGVPEFATSYVNNLPNRITSNFNIALWRYFEWFYNGVEAVTVLSDYPKNELIGHGIESKIEVIPMWIDNSKITPSDKTRLFEKYKIPKDMKIFLYLGRLDKDKDLHTLIHAFNLVTKSEKYNDIGYLVLAGEGKERKSLKKLVRELNIDIQVKFTGLIDPEKVHEIYFLSDFFVMPGPYETQSIATLQAIAYGLKAIVADSGALPEIAKRLPEVCTTYKVSEPGSLAKEMQNLLDNPSEKKYTPGKFHVFYSKRSSINKLEKLYYEAAGN